MLVLSCPWTTCGSIFFQQSPVGLLASDEFGEIKKLLLFTGLFLLPDEEQ